MYVTVTEKHTLATTIWNILFVLKQINPKLFFIKKNLQTTKKCFSKIKSKEIKMI